MSLIYEAWIRIIRSSQTIPTSSGNIRSKHFRPLHRRSNQCRIVHPKIEPSDSRNYALVWETSLKFYGAPLAVAVSSPPALYLTKISYWLMAILLILYILYPPSIPALTKKLHRRQTSLGRLLQQSPPQLGSHVQLCHLRRRHDLQRMGSL
jgi:hypothetical protein